MPHLLLLEVGYELGEKADEVEKDDDGAVEVRRVPAPALPGLQGGLSRLHLAHRPLEHLKIKNLFLHLLSCLMVTQVARIIVNSLS